MPIKNQRLVWVIWFTIFTPFLIYSFSSKSEVLVNNWPDILVFLILMLIASLFPIKFFNTPFMPIQGVSLTLFLFFGMVIEALVIQIAIFSMLLRVRVPKEDAYRFPLNSLIFIGTSFGAGSLFYLTGGTVPINETNSIYSMILPIIVYVSSYFLLNNYLIYILKNTLSTVKIPKFFNRALLLQALTTVLVVPVGITLTVSYHWSGYLAIILVGIPIIAFFIILQLYNRSRRDARLLEKVSQFGHNINDTSTINDILLLFSQSCRSIFSSENILLYERQKNGKLHRINVPSELPEEMTSITFQDGVTLEVFNTKKSLLFHSKNAWKHLDPLKELTDTQSILSVPVYRKQVAGIITLTSSKPRVFGKVDLRLLEIMGNYTVVALQNIRQLEQTKQESIMCSLTKIYNFRYFDTLLKEQYNQDSLMYSMILIDLDHFKRINDAYGHYSGNKVLKEVASILRDLVGNKGVLARYGGEEFVILLDGQNSLNSTGLANTIREKLENHIFYVTEDLSDGKDADICITASIGVATKEEPSQSPLSVLRNADRAMYTGAKEQGRNKVAVYASASF
ncbi:sensor domain-containing diguanylate cyclase [Salipaludibacillus sp. CF4.18]|uniref:sensor domain-containing diguanylate cyclase n=1 Tax=Salipaludibacillus sp. CF4.18 TaxID=3373081 RepID=UPI003EE54334